MKYDLKNTTFLIPLRAESMVRLENLLMTVEYLTRNFDTNIIVLQADKYENGLVPRLLNKKIKYRFVEDYDTVFYRTKYLNQMTREAGTQFLGIWDADVIVPYKQVIDSLEKLREGYEIAYPFDGHFYDTTDIVREMYFKNRQLKILENNQNKMNLTYSDKAVGGAFMVNRQAYMDVGMENEEFYGWGPEDGERIDRWNVFGYKIYRAKGNLYHLSHSRGNNSMHRSPEQFVNTNKRCRLTVLSNAEDIKKHTQMEIIK